MTDERMEMLLKESFVNIRPGAELQENYCKDCMHRSRYLPADSRGTGTICAGGS